MHSLQKAKRLEDGVWVEGSMVKQMDEEAIGKTRFFSVKFQTWCPVDKDTICFFIGMVDRNGEKIWENDLIKDRFGSIFLVGWNPVQYAYYGILLKQKNEKQGQGCFRMGAFRPLDLERMGSILDQESVEGRWVTYFSQWICRLVFHGWFRKKIF